VTRSDVIFGIYKASGDSAGAVAANEDGSRPISATAGSSTSMRQELVVVVKLPLPGRTSLSAPTTFASVQVLIAQIRDYITHWNTNPTPFAWTATAEEILAKVQLVQTNIKQLVDNNAK
jgi:hypothetical protein